MRSTYVRSIITKLFTLADLRWALCSDDREITFSKDKSVYTAYFTEKTMELYDMRKLINLVAVKNNELIGFISLFLLDQISLALLI